MVGRHLGGPLKERPLLPWPPPENPLPSNRRRIAATPAPANRRRIPPRPAARPSTRPSGPGHQVTLVEAAEEDRPRQRLDAHVPGRGERRLVDARGEADHCAAPRAPGPPDGVEHPGSPEVDDHQHRPPGLGGAADGLGQLRGRRHEAGAGEAGPHLRPVHQVGDEGDHRVRPTSGALIGDPPRRRASTT